MTPLHWTTEAVASLNDLYRSIARTRPETAMRTVESILNKVDSLAEAPKLGHPYPHHPNGGLRVLHYGNFRVAYLLEESGEIVVLGVFNGLVFLPPL